MDYSPLDYYMGHTYHGNSMYLNRIWDGVGYFQVTIYQNEDFRRLRYNSWLQCSGWWGKIILLKNALDDKNSFTCANSDISTSLISKGRKMLTRWKLIIKPSTQGTEPLQEDLKEWLSSTKGNRWRKTTERRVVIQCVLAFIWSMLVSNIFKFVRLIQIYKHCDSKWLNGSISPSMIKYSSTLV